MSSSFRRNKNSHLIIPQLLTLAWPLYFKVYSAKHGSQGKWQRISSACPKTSCFSCKISVHGTLQTSVYRLPGLLQQPTHQGIVIGLATCHSQTTSPFGCLNNFVLRILSNFLGGTSSNTELLFQSKRSVGNGISLNRTRGSDRQRARSSFQIRNWCSAPHSAAPAGLGPPPGPPDAQGYPHRR